MVAGYCQMGKWTESLPGGSGVMFIQYVQVVAPETLPAAAAVAASSQCSQPTASREPLAAAELPKQDSYPQGILSAVASTVSMVDFGSASTGSLQSDDMDMSDARSDASERTNLGGSWLLLDTASPVASPTSSGCSSPRPDTPTPSLQPCPPSLDKGQSPREQQPPHSEELSCLQLVTPSPPQPTDGYSKVLEQYSAETIPNGSAAAIDTYMADKIQQQGLEDPVWVVDLGAVKRLHEAWTAAMPRVRPFYAAKCNMDPGLLAALSSLGAGFDCASEVQILALSNILMALAHSWPLHCAALWINGCVHVRAAISMMHGTARRSHSEALMLI